MMFSMNKYLNTYKYFYIIKIHYVYNKTLFFNQLHSCGNSSVGRVQPCQGWGREFESRFPLLILIYCITINIDTILYIFL